MFYAVGFKNLALMSLRVAQFSIVVVVVIVVVVDVAVVVVVVVVVVVAAFVVVEVLYMEQSIAIPDRKFVCISVQAPCNGNFSVSCCFLSY